jgi:hypothetical protein
MLRVDTAGTETASRKRKIRKEADFCPICGPGGLSVENLNAETLAAMEDACSGRNMSPTTIEEMIAEICEAQSEAD